MREVNTFPVTINKIKSVDVVQTQKWGTVWNNHLAIDFGQIMGNIKLVDCFPVLSKEKRESAYLPALVADSKCWRWEKAFTFHLWVRTTFPQHGKWFFRSTGSPCTLWVISAGWRAQDPQGTVPLRAVTLLSSLPLSHQDLDHSFTSEMFSNIHLFLIY